MPRKPALIDLDPRTLTVHPMNVRRTLGDLRPLTRSIKERGVRVPLIVVPHDNGHLLIAGHRRREAAIAAEAATVPCVVRQDVEGDADQIADMLIENGNREALTAGEEAAAYEQLSVLGLTDADIARRTGVTPRHVKKARTVAASEVATAVTDRYDLTLDQALVIVEFQDDATAVRDLTVTARKNPGQFPHLASRLRQEREDAAAYTAAVAAYTEAGVTILDRARLRASATVTSLRDLTDTDDGTPIEPDTHSECPGHTVFVSEHRPDEPEFFCLDPDTHGHRSRYQRATGAAPTPMTDEAKAERREVLDNNKAWRAAEPVRREFVRTLLSRKTPPKGTLRFVATEILSDPESVGRGGEDLLADLLGVETAGGYRRTVAAGFAARSSETQLPLALLAQVAADREQGMDVHTWRNPAARAARWLRFLADVGYTLSDIESRVATTAAGEEATAAA